MQKKLKKGQIVYVKNQKYYINNMIEYIEREDKTWIWQEYEIHDENKNICWLCVEEDEKNKVKYSLYKEYKGKINDKEETFFINGIRYRLSDDGVATVKDYFGNADVDINEKCEYYDYLSDDGIHILSVEKWEGEIEYSVGEFIGSEQVKITEELNSKQIKNVNNTDTKKNIKLGLIIIFITIAIIVFVFGMVNLSHNSINNFLEKNSDFSYVTSVTNNENNQKAKVYKSSITTIEEVAKKIIDGVSGKVTKVTEDEQETEESGIGLSTSDEYAYIYKDDNIVFVQVSTTKYMSNEGGTMYHNRHRTHYYRVYRSSKSHSSLSSYAASARQSSVNSRKTSGGGTSSGK